MKRTQGVTVQLAEKFIHDYIKQQIIGNKEETHEKCKTKQTTKTTTTKSQLRNVVQPY